MAKTEISVVVPNWNGEKLLRSFFGDLARECQGSRLIVVDNGSTDGSVAFLESQYPDVKLVKLPKNRGFAGGVNAGLRSAIEYGSKYVGVINNDVLPQTGWLSSLQSFLDNQPKVGIVTSKILSGNGKQIDSTGESYSVWGLPFPRGRGEPASDKYDKERWVFGASGGASLYRAEMLREVGLFDEDFFAYYEDVDISFRAQLADWKVAYEPKAVVHHQIGATSSQIGGFTTYQTIKNLPQLFWKNVPSRLLLASFPRFLVAYSLICLSAYSRGQFVPATRGLFAATLLLPKKVWQRRWIQSHRKVSAAYIKSILVHDLPPGAHRLRALRNFGRSR